MFETNNRESNNRTSLSSSERRAHRRSTRTSLSVSSAGSLRSSVIELHVDLLNDNDYEATRQQMHNLIDAIRQEKQSTSFDETFLHQQSVIGYLLRLFNENAEEIEGKNRIQRETMIKLLEKSNIINDHYTSTMFVEDWNRLRKHLIKTQIYERKMKTFDFMGFMQMFDLIKLQLDVSKDEVFKLLLGSKVYRHLKMLKELEDRTRLGLFSSIKDESENRVKSVDPKTRNRRAKSKKPKSKKKKKINKTNKKKKKKKKKNIKTTKEPIKAPALNKDEQFTENDEIDNDLMNRLMNLFHMVSGQFQTGLIDQRVLDKWLRTSRVISDYFSMNLIDAVLSSVLAQQVYKSTSSWNNQSFTSKTFLECIHRLARQISMPVNEFVKKMLTVDESAFQVWRTEAEQSSENQVNEKPNRSWNNKRILLAVQKMREVVDESRKLHLTDDERKRLRSLFREFAAFAYRRQSSHLEARLTNTVLSNWMRECAIFDDKYTVNELDKDFISILGDFTLNGVYPPGARDIDFDGFITLIQTIAAHKHIRADDLLQMIFHGPRSPLQKTAEFNEHMDRTKIQTSQVI